jgi:hypothetical protein
MRVGVLGTGSVGEAIATALVKNGHEVKLGSRKNSNEKAEAWINRNGPGASRGDYNESAAFGEIVFICLSGSYTLDAVSSIEKGNLKDKIVIDITNPLDFSKGRPPVILEEYAVVSLGERIQEELPDSFVVKTLNTVNYKLMVDARLVNNADHHLFLSGNNEEAKNKVKDLLSDNFYWKHDHFVDLGSIKTAKVIEAIVPFWVSVWHSLETPLFNFKIVQ